MFADRWPQLLMPWTAEDLAVRAAAWPIMTSPRPGLRYQERIARLQPPQCYYRTERGMAKQRRLAARLTQARVRARHLARRSRG
ncbi:hypothetical protein ABT369_51150 [Dactylosporangium sp. NPDC000244]|uniref:hypothetical protein n=1 Tax=Dactylosporangium sp. NPDC000244 TaxID=3154365 RepID=UPI003316A66C